jgi:hypothetical protein
MSAAGAIVHMAYAAGVSRLLAAGAFWLYVGHRANPVMGRNYDAVPLCRRQQLPEARATT